MTSGKAALLADLESLIEHLEEDTSDGACLPDGLLHTLKSDLSTCNRFMEKRRQRRPNSVGFSHSVAVRIGRLN